MTWVRALLTNGISAALFGILLLLVFVLTHHGAWPWLGLYRYDFLLLYALIIQGILLYCRFETAREAGVIALFHVLAMLMELFLTSPSIGSWHYPEAGVMRINNVPLFAGFMYSAVGSFLARSLRLFAVSFERLPSFVLLFGLAIASYLNFFTHHFVADARWLLFAVSIWCFWSTRVCFSVGNQRYQHAFLPYLLGCAVLIWTAENIATFSNIWLYPSQVDAWHWVGVGKIGSWYLLLLLSLVLVLWVMGQRHAQGVWQLDDPAVLRTGCKRS